MHFQLEKSSEKVLDKWQNKKWSFFIKDFFK